MRDKRSQQTVHWSRDKARASKLVEQTGHNTVCTRAPKPSDGTSSSTSKSLHSPFVLLAHCLKSIASINNSRLFLIPQFLIFISINEFAFPAPATTYGSYYCGVLKHILDPGDPEMIEFEKRYGSMRESIYIFLPFIPNPGGVGSILVFRCFRRFGRLELNRGEQPTGLLQASVRLSILCRRGRAK